MPQDVLYFSNRAGTLRGVTLLCFLPVPLTVWLLSLGSPATWSAESGGLPWWILPAALIALTLVLPAALLWLHDRYVLRAERVGDTLRITTFLVWGQRTREIAVGVLRVSRSQTIGERPFAPGLTPVVNAPAWLCRLPDGTRLLFDLQGEAPAGWPALESWGEPGARRR